MAKTECVPPAALAEAKQTVVQMNTGGRGFIAGTGIDRYVITAAHCAPLEQLSEAASCEQFLRISI
jgi:hypothetical protein